MLFFFYHDEGMCNNKKLISGKICRVGNEYDPYDRMLLIRSLLHPAAVCGSLADTEQNNHSSQFGPSLLLLPQLAEVIVTCVTISVSQTESTQVLLHSPVLLHNFCIHVLKDAM